MPARTAEVEEGAWLTPALLSKLVVQKLRELKFVRGVVVAGLTVIHRWIDTYIHTWIDR